MRAAPSRIAESIVALFLPPACREEVLGDLQERYAGPLRYGIEALFTVPLVVMSRIRRTADPPVVLMQSFVLYLSYSGAAWFQQRALLSRQWGLLRLAVPAAVALLGLVLEDAYARPGLRSPLAWSRGPVVALGLVLLSQAILHSAGPDIALPALVLSYGAAMGLLLTVAVRMLFPPLTTRLQGAGAPAYWLKQSGPEGMSETALRVGAWGLVTLLVGLVCAWVGEPLPVLKPRVIGGLALLLMAVQMLRRA